MANPRTRTKMTKVSDKLSQTFAKCGDSQHDASKPVMEFREAVLTAIRKLQVSKENFNMGELRRYVNAVCEMVKASHGFRMTKFFTKAVESGLIAMVDEQFELRKESENSLPKGKAANKKAGRSRNLQNVSKSEDKSRKEKTRIKKLKVLKKFKKGIKQTMINKSKYPGLPPASGDGTMIDT